jgi:hypothetical protein
MLHSTTIFPGRTSCTTVSVPLTEKDMVPVISKWTLANGQCREFNKIYNQILTGCHPEIGLSKFGIFIYGTTPLI